MSDGFDADFGDLAESWGATYQARVPRLGRYVDGVFVPDGPAGAKKITGSIFPARGKDLELLEGGERVTGAKILQTARDGGLEVGSELVGYEGADWRVLTSTPVPGGNLRRHVLERMEGP